MTSAEHPRRLFVAVGDSFTEGLGDTDDRLPNGVRGWADRVAERLAKAEPGWEYANLAVRSKRLRQIIDDQLDAAIALKPTLVTVYAGGNDIMDTGTDMTALLVDYERLVAALTATGATVVVFTGYEVPLAPAVWLFKRRNQLYNQAVRQIAEVHRAVLIDYASFEGLDDRRMWSSDRLHLSKAGHKLVASRVLDALGISHSIRLKDRGRSARLTVLEWQRARRAWVRDWVVPLVNRKLRGITLGDAMSPRWPTAVRVPRRGGLRKVTAQRAAENAESASREPG